MIVSPCRSRRMVKWNLQHSRGLLILITVLVLMAVCSGQASSSGSFENRFATAASNSIVPLIAVGELSLYAEGSQGRREAMQGARALIATGILTEALKYTVREKRPLSSSTDSFPSGHASAAFAMAAVWGEYHPKYSWLGYGTAAVIGWSRVELREHRWTDVAAGALLGHFVAKHFATKRVVITPNGLALQSKF